MERFTKREEELMNFLWKYGKPVTSYEMVDLCKDRDWKDSYIHIMIRSLEKKGAIECCGTERSGIKYARKFRTAVSKDGRGGDPVFHYWHSHANCESTR